MMSSFAHTAVLTRPRRLARLAAGVVTKSRLLCGNGRRITRLILAYALKADLARLRIPAARPPRKADHLWQHTCLRRLFR